MQNHTHKNEQKKKKRKKEDRPPKLIFSLHSIFLEHMMQSGCVNFVFYSFLLVKFKNVPVLFAIIVHQSAISFIYLFFVFFLHLTVCDLQYILDKSRLSIHNIIHTRHICVQYICECAFWISCLRANVSQYLYCVHGMRCYVGRREANKHQKDICVRIL